MTVSVLAPAKINLGLEVIRKRNDGFHDIATVFQTVSVFDRLHLSVANHDSVRITNRIEQIEANLVSRALMLAREQGLTKQQWRVELEKRIPVAAGLGGASADTAATLLAIAGQRGRAEIAGVASELGSDVPFLLRGGAALGKGRGDQLESLPSLGSCWILLAAPSIELERKTARLYGTLAPTDFSNGSRVDRVATALREHRLPDPADLANAFDRPLATLLPEVGYLRAAMLTAGAPFAALSGAGPTHYTIVSELSDAIAIAGSLRRIGLPKLRVMVVRPAGSCPLVRVEKTIDPNETL